VDGDDFQCVGKGVGVRGRGDGMGYAGPKRGSLIDENEEGMSGEDATARGAGQGGGSYRGQGGPGGGVPRGRGRGTLDRG